MKHTITISLMGFRAAETSVTEKEYEAPTAEAAKELAEKEFGFTHGPSALPVHCSTAAENGARAAKTAAEFAPIQAARDQARATAKEKSRAGRISQKQHRKA